MRNPMATVKISILVSISVLLFAGCATQGGQQTAKITLSGAQESPPVTTSATGSGQITVSSDRSVSGSVTTSGVAGTAAHIHEAPPGKNGPVAIPLTKTSDGVWSVPTGVKLSESQYASYLAGNLYVNVHSAANPGGEIRGQITPPGGVKAAAPAASSPPAKPASGGSYSY